jgi:hypothetical protein
VANKSWAAVSTGGKSNTVVPSLALDGSRVVAAYRIDGSGQAASAEAITFTPSHGTDVVGPRRDQITSGWSNLGDPVLVPRAGGGLQVIFSGLHATSTALNGTLVEARNADGSFGPPVLASDRSSSEIDGAAVLAPDGQPIWASYYIGALTLWKGTSNPVSADLSGVVNGTDYIPSVGRDASGRYWVAWYVLGKGTDGLWVVQIDPSTLHPIGAPQRVPGGSSIDNENLRLAFACARQCRLVYQQGTALQQPLVSWAPGERKPVVVAPAGSRSPWLAAAYTASGRLWVVSYNTSKVRYEAKLGNAAGAGGTTVALGKPTSGGEGFAVGAISTSAGLVVVSNWVGRTNVFTRYANVVSQ